MAPVVFKKKYESNPKIEKIPKRDAPLRIVPGIPNKISEMSQILHIKDVSKRSMSEQRAPHGGMLSAKTKKVPLNFYF
jgi:hypothetical protein